MERDIKKEKKMSYRMECKYKGAGLTHYVLQSDDSPF